MIEKIKNKSVLLKEKDYDWIEDIAEHNEIVYQDVIDALIIAGWKWVFLEPKNISKFSDDLAKAREARQNRKG